MFFTHSVWCKTSSIQQGLGCFYLLFLSFSLFSCFSPAKKTVSFSSLQREKINHALKLAKNRDFLPAGRLYDELALSLKDPSSRIFMLFNAGSAYKEAGQCKKALSRYRKLLDLSLKKPDFKARGLFEISSAYECLGDSELALISLKDVKSIQGSLPWELRQMALPARLAIAYARLKEMSPAKNQHSMALTKSLQAGKMFSSEKALNEKMSRMFYIMGRSYDPKSLLNKTDSAGGFLRAFPYYQTYLLQSLLLENKDWSPLAKKELESLFDKLAFALSSIRKKDIAQYKQDLVQAINSAQALIKKEKSKRWQKFYFKKSRQAVQLLSK